MRIKPINERGRDIIPGCLGKAISSHEIDNLKAIDMW